MKGLLKIIHTFCDVYKRTMLLAISKIFKHNKKHSWHASVPVSLTFKSMFISSRVVFALIICYAEFTNILFGFQPNQTYKHFLTWKSIFVTGNLFIRISKEGAILSSITWFLSYASSVSCLISATTRHRTDGPNGPIGITTSH